MAVIVSVPVVTTYILIIPVIIVIIIVVIILIVVLVTTARRRRRRGGGGVGCFFLFRQKALKLPRQLSDLFLELFKKEESVCNSLRFNDKSSFYNILINRHSA